MGRDQDLKGLSVLLPPGENIRSARTLYVCLYLLAIVLANLLTMWLGPWVTPANALLLIGLNITSRDFLHEVWDNKGLVPKMGALIAFGATLTMLLNRGAGRIAIASTVAFALAAVGDTVMYALLGSRARRVKINGSNVVSSAIDSVIFPWIAFGGFMPLITIGQFLAKTLGGWIWSFILEVSND